MVVRVVGVVGVLGCSGGLEKVFSWTIEDSFFLFVSPVCVCLYLCVPFP